ncbi:tripartite tricarboxylate transporter substrate binding protein [Polaromonas sp. SM01]|uniref:Bug family tripartite tricarboxylate transporter substrate binding protein n=1 Tax=Polaromonas sp. SM01 TaxID=3085630 RepID=UPI00298200E5|nr:tripartite tricarboxylate transporter substrate binding protein [Polaromonas sp. SM01]MDW5441447.1 tripartite tricarboxylate transporter substrate binding protein [Polaromonas sp. SM01]
MTTTTRPPRFAHLTRGLLLASAVGIAGLPVLAQTAWPDKPIRFVVPYTPGGGTDTVTRHIANTITQDTQWTFLIDNKAGGGGNIGLDMVAKSKADGYTIGMGQTANLAINPALLPSMPFDPARDFAPVALVAELPTVMVVRADSPWKTLADAIKAAKAKPGELKQALAGTGTVGHLAGEMLARRTGIKVLNVPYKGAAPAITDLLGGQTDYMFATPQAVIGMVKGNKLRALAVTSTKRLAILPEVPTVAEAGYKGFEAVDWKVIVAPAGTPAEVIKRLNAAVAKALTHPTMIAQLAAEGSAPLSGDPAQVARYLKAEQAEWGKLIRDAGIKLE